MTDGPEPVSKVVARVLAGLAPDAEDFLCRECGERFVPSEHGAEDGYCPKCAAEKRRSGEWYTPTMADPIEQHVCPLCVKFTKVNPDQELQTCEHCGAHFNPDLTN